jgi:hypothetical protein
VNEENFAPLCVFLYRPSITPFFVFTSGLMSDVLRFLMHFMVMPAEYWAEYFQTRKQVDVSCKTFSTIIRMFSVYLQSENFFGIFL